MRNALAVVAVLVLETACGGGSNHPSTTGNPAGTSSGGMSTTGGSGPSDAGLPAGSPCTSNESCGSDVCGLDGGGRCCDFACTTGNAICGGSGCDQTGACIYPDAGITCAPSTCADGMLSLDQCDGFGTCFINPAAPCPGNYACSTDRSTCDTTCSANADCAQGYYCADGGACLAKIATGACGENAACTSGICGLDGTGNCCQATCTNTAAPCGATGCDATSGACVFPDTTVLCGPGGTETCSGGTQDDPNVHCNGNGSCPPQMTTCAPFVCGASACFTTCTDDSSCVTGTAFCNEDAGVGAGICQNKLNAGPCGSDDACVSGVCGISGTGDCCNQACAVVTPPCGATGCDPASAACLYPGKTTLCGDVPESCAGGIQQNPSACDGDGGCNDTPGTIACTPFICGANACFVSCTDATSCVSGDVCDTANSTCCGPVAAGGTITVDGVLGSDATACCGYGGAGACQTVSHAMALIDAAQAKNVTISASIGGVGGDWPAGAETYPIKLGWGAELSAPGIYFLDRNGTNQEIIDVAQYSANDTIGYASIAGAAANQVGIGLSAAHTNQLTDSAAVRIEAGQTLYIADALLNGSARFIATAMVVSAGGSLVLGQDHSGAITGTVTIGNDGNAPASDGWDGIICETGNGKGCTITDAPLSGQSSVVIEGQEDMDISAPDFASITLTSAPVIGVAPASAGFGQCPAGTAGSSSPTGKPDAFSSKGPAVLLQGQATMTFDNGTVQCISGAGFELVKSQNKDGNPSLTLAGTTIQNTEQAVFASAGTVTISGSTIQFNYNGVEQSSDGTNTATVDLSGAGTDGGVNTVVCSDGAESINEVDGGTSVPGVNVLNTTSAVLNASNVAWDTSGPDVFSCDAALKTCTCEIKTCTNPGGDDDMDAVYESTGTITTTDNTVSAIATANGCN